ncbi:MAG: SMEK domain-containing protein [Flavobacteriaceae bacterium]|nr:SMEK domain-containing protein [Flavobacteriaceae bacterium]
MLKAKMKVENSVNDYGLQLMLENTVISILNTVYNYQLVNANSIEYNYPAVDGLCNDNGIALQITSTFNKTKIISTVKKYLKNEVYKTHDNLKFFFLKDIRSINKDTIKEIETLLVQKNIRFDQKTCFIDYDTIYQKLYYDQDVSKTQKVLEIIDKVLGVLPTDKISGFTSIGVSFENDEIQNTKLVIDSILKQGINTYITSEELYKSFKEHKDFDYLIFTNEATKIQHIKHFIIILSDKYISCNLANSLKCSLLKYIINESVKTKIVAFNAYLKNIKNIQNKRFSTYSFIDNVPENIQEFTDDFLKEFLSSKVNEVIVNPENIKSSLINIRKGFKHKILKNTKQYKTILFFMENMDIEILYVVLKNRFSTKEAINYLKTLSHTFNSKNINVLIPRNPDHKTRRVIQNFKYELKHSNVYYIDEFLFEETIKNISQLPILGVEDFVKPVIKEKGKIIHLSNIFHWIIEERYPSIAIIKAPGGIGKTTLVEKIHDDFIDKENQYKYLVLFIEANDFIKNFGLVDFSDENEYDLYTIFKKCHSQGNNIDEQLFYNNYRHGNILMIIDGVDEIISTITSFNLETFLAKISQFAEKIGKGKILLTSRDLYVKDIESFLNSVNGNEKSIVTYDLMPFNKDLALEYFKLNALSESQSNTALNLLEGFVLEIDKNEEYIYPPFVLDIVLDFIRVTNEIDNDMLDYSMFDSKYLVQNHRLDYIIQQTFNRENNKKFTYGYDLGIDEQVAFFCLMAIEKKGHIKEKQVLPLLNQLGYISNSEKIAQSLKDHPFLKENDGVYSFLYRFLETEFSIIGLFNLLKKQGFTSYNDYFIDVFAYECSYNSIISKGLMKKIKLDSFFTDKNIIPIIADAIRTILLRKEININQKKAVSNLFLLLYEYFYKKSDIRLLTNTLIKNIFSHNNNQYISNFFLYDIPDSLNMILDLRGLYFSCSEINNYANFVFCDFDEITSFENSCRIENINLTGVSIFDKLDSLSLSEENFDNVRGNDNSLHKILSLKKLGKGGIEKELRKYLKAFYNNRILKDNITIRQLKTNYQNKHLVNLITEEMVREGVLSVSDETITLNPNLKGKINKFVYQARSFIEIKRVYRKIAMNM